MRVFPLGKGLKPVYIYLSENHEAAILHALFIHLFGVMLKHVRNFAFKSEFSRVLSVRDKNNPWKKLLFYASAFAVV